MNYDPEWDDDEKKWLLRPEYVDVYGIPFSVIPYKGRAQDQAAPEDKPKNRVWAMPDREELEIRFPIVEGYVFKTTKGLLQCDVDKMEPLSIDSKLVPKTTYLRAAAGYMDSHQQEKTPFEYVQQDRNAYYAQTHFQSILFLITQEIINDLQDWNRTDTKSKVMRLKSRHQLFPQVFSFVQMFVQKKVNFNGVDPRELGLERYSKIVVERMRDSIHPDDSQGEPPLLPILNRYRPVGSTSGVDFVTTRPTTPSTRSHINSVVIDSGFEKDEWEKKAVSILDSSSFVSHFARNDHLGLVIPYEYLGVDYSYEPDFIVRLVNGVTLLLEIKGYERDREKNNAKHQAAQRWVTAVNNLKDFGKWDFLVCRDMELLAPMIGELLGQGMPVVSLKSDGDLF